LDGRRVEVELGHQAIDLTVEVERSRPKQLVPEGALLAGSGPGHVETDDRPGTGRAALTAGKQ
jgi:hypothetical protein